MMMPEEMNQGVAPKKISRRKARETAFLTLFAAEFSADGRQPDEEQNQEHAALAAEVLDTAFDPYTKELVEGVEQHVQELDGIFVPFLTGSWKKERLSRVTRTLLRLAVFELFFVPDMADQTGVVINESVELCKAYAGEGKEPGFLNGVLGAVVRSHQE